MRYAAYILIVLFLSGCAIFHKGTPGEKLDKLLTKYPQLVTTKDTVIAHTTIIAPRIGGVGVHSTGTVDTLKLHNGIRFIVLHDTDSVAVNYYLPGDTVRDTIRVPAKVVKAPTVPEKKTDWATTIKLTIIVLGLYFTYLIVRKIKS